MTNPIEKRIIRGGIAGATAISLTVGPGLIDANTKPIEKPAPPRTASAKKPAHPLGYQIVPQIPVEAGDLNFRIVLPNAPFSPAEEPTLTPTPIGGASGPERTPTRTPTPTPETPTPTVTPTPTETPIPRWTIEQLLANTRIVDFIPTYTDTSRNWSLSINSRRVDESPYNEDLYDPQKDALVQTLVPYAKQHGFRQAEYIIVTQRYQLPSSLYLGQASVRDPESGRVIPIGDVGGTVYQGKLLVVWRAEPNLLSNSPGFISNLNFSTSSDLIAAAYSGGNVAAHTPTNLRELANTEPLRTISSTP